MIALPFGSRLGRYRVLDQLGRGGMATVFRCEDPLLNRHVAVKVLPAFHPDNALLVERFINEARTVALLNHPNILQVHDYGEDKGFIYIVTELLLGGTLKDRLEAERMESEEIRTMMKALGDGLGSAHAAGVVHRDLKPSNILIAEDGRPVIADFGLARLLESESRLTPTGQILGSPAYSSPEQAMGADTDERTDLYSLGVILYHMFLGQTPFQGDTPGAMLLEHIHQSPAVPTTIDPSIGVQLELMLLKALAKDPAERFQTISEMIEGFEAAVQADFDAEQPPDTGPVEIVQSSCDIASAIPAPARMRPNRARLIMGGSGAVMFLATLFVIAVLIGQQFGDESDQLPRSSVDGVGPTETRFKGLADSRTAIPAMLPTDCQHRISLHDVGSVSGAELNSMQDMARDTVVGIRGLSDPPTVDTVERSKIDLCELAVSYFQRPEVRSRILQTEALYQILGLLSEHQDLASILLSLQLQQVSALFDDATGSVHIRNDLPELSPRLEVSYAVAYWSALQQHLFHVSSLRRSASSSSSDELRALDALVGGDAAAMGSAYVDRVIAADQEAMRRFLEPVADTELPSAPAIVRKMSMFPLIEGRRFVEYLLSLAGGWENVDRAFHNPPRTTEQVLHPGLYQAGEPARSISLPDLTQVLGEDWSVVSEDTIGEFFIRSYLETELDAATARRAADGWGGDRYVLLKNKGAEGLLILTIEFDSQDEADQFLMTYPRFVRSATTGKLSATMQISQSAVAWVTNNQTTTLLNDEERSVDLIIGPDPNTVQTVFNYLYAERHGIEVKER